MINRLPKVLKCSKQFQLVMVRVGLEAKIPLVTASSAPTTVQCIIILSLIFELFYDLPSFFRFSIIVKKERSPENFNTETKNLP